MANQALGLIETSGLTGALEACHAATSAGEVVIASAEPMDTGHVTVKIEGEWSAVRAAIDAGARAAHQAGELVSIHMIPRPDSGVHPILPYQRFVVRYNPENQTSTTERAPRKPRATPKRAGTRTKKPAAETAAQPEAGAGASAEAGPTIPSVPAALLPESQPEIAAAPVEFEAMSVVALRKYARSIVDLPIQGREISMANKAQLLEALRSVINRG